MQRQHRRRRSAEKRIRESISTTARALSWCTCHRCASAKKKSRPFLGHFMHKLAKHYGLKKREVPPSVLEKCQKYSWPGNLDQLESFVNRYLLSGDSTLALNSPCTGSIRPTQARSSDTHHNIRFLPTLRQRHSTSLSYSSRVLGRRRRKLPSDSHWKKHTGIGRRPPDCCGASVIARCCTRSSGIR